MRSMSFLTALVITTALSSAAYSQDITDAQAEIDKAKTSVASAQAQLNAANASLDNATNALKPKPVICWDGSTVTPPAQCPDKVPASLSIANASTYEGQTATMVVTRAGGNFLGDTIYNWAAPILNLGGTGLFAAGSTQSTFRISTVDNAVDAPDLIVAVSITSADPITDGSANLRVMDNDNPIPVPPTMISCIDAGTWVPSGQVCPQVIPNGIGLAPLASNFDLSLAVKAGSIPPRQPQANEDKGAFRFICGAGQLNYDDSLVYFGQKGKSHLHQYYGNTAADADSTFEILRTKGGSTCNYVLINGKWAPADGVAANRSAYWTSAMLDGKGNVILPAYIQWYYKREPNNSTYDDKPSKCDPSNLAPGSIASLGGKCYGVPNGLNFITGYDAINMKRTSNSFQFLCVDKVTGASSPVYRDLPSLKADPKCVAPNRVEARIASPTCWDSTKLDSPDHRSHLVPLVRNNATGQTECDSAHKDLIAQVTFGAFYDIIVGDDLALWHWSNDPHAQAMDSTMKNGEGGHIDYREAWDGDVKNTWVVNDIDGYRNASYGQLGGQVPTMPPLTSGAHVLMGGDSGTVGTVAATFSHRQPIPVNPNGPTAQ